MAFGDCQPRTLQASRCKALRGIYLEGEVSGGQNVQVDLDRIAGHISGIVRIGSFFHGHARFGQGYGQFGFNVTRFLVLERDFLFVTSQF